MTATATAANTTHHQAIQMANHTLDAAYAAMVRGEITVADAEYTTSLLLSAKQAARTGDLGGALETLSRAWGMLPR